MRKILRSKPVLLIGGAALARKIANRSKMSRKKKGAGKKAAGFALTAAGGAAFRYFTDSISGPRRREKIKRLMGKGGAPDWNSESGNDSQSHLQLQDSSPGS